MVFSMTLSSWHLLIFIYKEKWTLCSANVIITCTLWQLSITSSLDFCWPICCERDFCLFWSSQSHIFLASVLWEGLHGPERGNSLINTSYVSSCWPTGFIHTLSITPSPCQDCREKHWNTHVLYHAPGDMESPVVCSRSALAISLVSTWKSSKRW